MRTCGACWWAEINAGSSEGDCFNQPPKVSALPLAEGEFQVVTVRPAVGRYDKACCFYSERAAGPPDRRSKAYGMLGYPADRGGAPATA